MKWKSIVVPLCMVVVLFGCAQGNTDEETFTGEEPEQPAYQDSLNAISPQAYSSVEGLELEPGTYISIIGKSEATAYWKQIQEGVEQAAADLNEALNYTGSDRIRVEYNAPEAEEDIDDQVNILDEELARYPDAIGIASIDAEACTVQFDLATENDIPVIAFDSGNSYMGILCTCKTDNVEAAGTGASKLCDEIGNSGKVLLLVHDSKSTSASERVSGFQEEIAAHSDVEIVEVIYHDQIEDLKKVIAAELNEQNASSAELPGAEITAEDLTEGDVLNYYLEKYPDLKGIFGTNREVTQWAVSALRERAELETPPADMSGTDGGDEQASADAVGGMNDTAGESKEAGENDTADGTGETENEIVVMGFDAGEGQLEALRSGEIDGLVVQNPFGMGYAAVIAAARTILDMGNEAEVNTGYIWVTRDNLEDESIQSMLYE